MWRSFLFQTSCSSLSRLNVTSRGLWFLFSAWVLRTNKEKRKAIENLSTPHHCHLTEFVNRYIPFAAARVKSDESQSREKVKVIARYPISAKRKRWYYRDYLPRREAGGGRGLIVLKLEWSESMIAAEAPMCAVYTFHLYLFTFHLSYQFNFISLSCAVSITHWRWFSSDFISGQCGKPWWSN